MPTFDIDPSGRNIQPSSSSVPEQERSGIRLSREETQKFAFVTQDRIVRQFLDGKLSFDSAQAVFSRLNEAAFGQRSVEALRVLAEIVRCHERPEQLGFFTRYFSQRLAGLLGEQFDLRYGQKDPRRPRLRELSDLEWSLLASILSDRNLKVLGQTHKDLVPVHRDLMEWASAYDKRRFDSCRSSGKKIESMAREISRLIQEFTDQRVKSSKHGKRIELSRTAPLNLESTETDRSRSLRTKGLTSNPNLNLETMPKPNCITDGTESSHKPVQLQPRIRPKPYWPEGAPPKPRPS